MCGTDGHTDTVTATWDFESTAKKLVAYFERQDQGRPEFVEGAKAARAWARVLNGDERDTAQLETVGALMQSGEAHSGTAWIELRLAFEQWLGSHTT